MHILGVALPERHFVKHALTHFYGIGNATAARLCARVQVHDRCRVRNLNETQVTALTAFLASPSNSPTVPALPLAAPDFAPPRLGAKFTPPQVQPPPDMLREIKLETDLRRQVRDNIAHQRMIGSYVGRRHAMQLPVRGQNTKSNAKTAKKLNRVERWA
ncbi:mitochondrial 30S ribosomal protein S13 [Epithele typhae]|uniref:mitochondrial 30S ribosomal protein S13 n=1 Tax=Epithele typhae TaxID=378194 RepID=UPI002008D024|nr:mitochondrial 30S ribosomal protein S13 [Epithele typhae]KAH9946158.1 mitochondrial 30S ribosomal protein S13 [Epithele typhae]